MFPIGLVGHNPQALRSIFFKEKGFWLTPMISFHHPISWSDPVNRVLIGLYMLADMEQEMQVIKRNLKVARDRWKFYVHQHMEFKEFQVAENVYLYINPKKTSLSIGSSTKLEPRHCRPFEILERIGSMAYQLALPLIVEVYNFFHVSLLKRYVKDVDHVIDWSVL